MILQLVSGGGGQESNPQTLIQTIKIGFHFWSTGLLRTDGGGLEMYSDVGLKYIWYFISIFCGFCLKLVDLVCYYTRM